MAVFQYNARNRSGQREEGSLTANDRMLALRELEQRGLIPVSLVEQGGAAGPAAPVPARAKFTLFTGRKARMNLREVLVFTTELSDLLASGMSLGNALGSLARRKTGTGGDEIVAALRDDIVKGVNLSDAMARHPETFSNLYVSMIRAGEASGALPEVLGRLVAHFERAQDTREKVTMALVYPSIVMTLGILTLVFSMVFVVPKFENVFAQLGAALPLPTRILIAGSRGLARYWPLILAVLCGLGLLVSRLLASERGRLVWHRAQLRLPLIKGIVASATFAQFARTLESLARNGVNLLKALAIVEQTMPNAVIAAEVRNARERVTDGTSISGPLAAGKVFPRIMTDMLAIGEQTADMPGALSHIARRYENELDRNLKIFTTALEPILIVVVAILVGFVAISILMAVFSLTNGLDV